MSVRAKFRVDRIERMLGTVKTATGYEQGEMNTLILSPVFSPEEGSENKQFWDASPGGQLSLNCINPKATAYFELGKEYYLDFTKAE